MAKGSKSVTIEDAEYTIEKRRSDSVIDIPKAIQKRALGNSYQDIADIQGVSKGAIYKALAPYRAELDTLNQYASNKDVYSDMASHKVYKAILNKSQESIESEKLSSLGAFLKTQHEITRLEQGKTTSNTGIMLVDLTKYGRPEGKG